MNKWRVVVASLVAGLMIGQAVAQNFPMHRGGPDRQGVQDGDPRQFNPGRAFLRWWDPLFALTTTRDNGQPGTTGLPVGTWQNPGDTRAQFSFVADLSVAPPPAPYVWNRPVAAVSVDRPWEPEIGSAPTYTWTFTGLTAGDQYAVSVNIPIGPTDVDPGTGSTLNFQTRFQVYEISGVVGAPVYQVVDTEINAGGWVRLGNGGNPTNVTYEVAPASTQIEVRLIGTVPRLSTGALADDPTNTVVIADAARISAPTATAGPITTQTVVARLAAGPFPWRAFGSRSEDTTIQDGSTLKSYGFPSISAYTYNGQLVTPPDALGRRNLIWSWPTLRPVNATDAEQIRFNAEKSDWLLGEGIFTGQPKRTDQTILVDNTNGMVRVGAAWTAETARPQFRGVDYLATPAAATSTSNVVYAPYLPDGDYFIEVYIPGGVGMATAATYEIRRAGVPIATDTVDQDSNAGRWVRLAVGQTNRWSSDAIAPLTLAVTGASTTPGGEVVADQVRFIRVADVSVRATPAFARARVNVGGTTAERDVVVVALENGRLYCLDARGFEAGGVPTGRTRVYWTYPSETTGSDPNHVAGEDGPDGMAEMPSNFGSSSPLIARVPTAIGARDLLFIGSQNGRVYSIDMEGRGDGTTTRRWTFPNDYPAPSVETALGPINGSVAYAETANGPTVFVPTVQGRLYALDAAGDASNKTTTTRWAYPGLSNIPLGPINMTPTLGWPGTNANDKIVYFGAGPNILNPNHTMYAISAVDGNSDQEGDLVWSVNGGAVSFNEFANISPAFAPSNFANQEEAPSVPNPFGPTMPNTLYVGNTNFEISAFDASNGNLLWATSELGASPTGPLTFAFLRGRLNSGSISPVSEPHVIVPLADGRYSSVYGQAGRLATDGSRLGWSIELSAPGRVPPVAVGGDISPDHNYIYGADPGGFILGFSWDPSLPDTGQVITPGEPPVNPLPNEGANDNTNQVMAAIANQARVDFILPGTFRDLQQRAAAGNLTQADITAAINQVTRRHFEFGETLHLLVHNLPDPAFFTPTFQYTMDLLLNAPGVSSQRAAFGLTPVNGAPADSNRAVLASFSFLGIGQNALAPGTVRLVMRVLSVSRPGANRTIPRPNYRPTDDIVLANPLAVALNLSPAAGQQAGLDLAPNGPDNIVNGTPTAKLSSLIQPFRPELNGQPDLLAHGQTGLTRLFVYDRSLMSLLFGRQRGLSSVRMQLSNLNFLGTPFKTLDPAIYAGLEDLPGSPGNNVSLDYPDIRRDRFTVAKSQFGVVENPLFQAVNLLPPDITDTDLDSYNNSASQYNQFLSRQLVPTTFDFELDVPRFQPPSSQGYEGANFVFVDGGAPGRQISGNNAFEPFRQFGLRASVALDERPVIGTPTVDLGSIPGGGGFTPIAPWDAPNFNLLDSRLHNAARFPFFRRFSVFNEGNVNLLNLRVAKNIQNASSAAVNPVALIAPTLHPLVQLDGRIHVHSDLDPFFAARALAGGTGLGDRVILQKARPDDGEPTRLRVNPPRRGNANLEVTGGTLLEPADFATLEEYEESIQDPKIAVSVPIGTPVGRFSNSVFVFEDRTPSAPYPLLDRVPSGAYEAYTDSPLNLLFTVRETRLTTSRTGKAMNMADNIPVDPAGRFTWSNQQPAAARAADGTLIVAISSDRLQSGTPNIFPSAKGEADAGQPSQWRIYFFTLSRGVTTPVTAFSPIGDLDTWRPNTATDNPATDRWFNPAVGAFPTASNTPTALFGIPATELDAGSLQFTNPVFPASGLFEPLSPFTSTGKVNRGSMYMAFVGEVTRQTGAGERRRETRLFLSNVVSTGNGGINATTPTALNIAGETPDPQARIGKPALVQTGNRATVLYPITSGGSTMIYMSHFNGSAWVQLPFARRGGNEAVGRLRVGEAFESVNAPSATLRASNSPAIGFIRPGSGLQLFPAVIETVFTGRLRGRSQPEVYLARIPANAQGLPLSNEPIGFTRAPNRDLLRDPLTQDAATGLYWSNGADLLFNTTTGFDVERLVVTGATQTFQSILIPNTARQAQGSSIVTVDTIYGGSAVMDLANGSVRFTGALIPRQTRLFIRYVPRLLRVSAAADVNHRAAGIQFDDRSTGDNSFWFDAAGQPITTGYESANRWIVTYGKTAARDSQASRPFMMTMRVGVRLPRPVQLNQNGAIAAFTYAFADGSTFPYQVDPAKGVVYFPANAEGRQVTITYAALDRDGRPLGSQTAANLPVELLVESDESAIPIEQVSNESAVSMALDALGGPGNVLDRPGLIWMFWSSTRSGGTDVFFQTVAPRFTSQRPAN